MLSCSFALIAYASKVYITITSSCHRKDTIHNNKTGFSLLIVNIHVRVIHYAKHAYANTKIIKILIQDLQMFKGYGYRRCVNYIGMKLISI